jgi:tetratricopeptide (TPR) repeat protein
LNDVEAESVKQFSLGIPYVVQLIAEMRQEDIDLATILGAPSDDRENESPSEKVVRMTSDRFLRYCIRGSADEKAIYAMAMMRQPNNDILQTMLGVTDLESEMRSLKARHSFVLLEGKYIKLHNNLKGFLQDHLRSEVAGQSPMVRELSDQAVVHLEARLSEWTQEFTDTADYFESDRIANSLLDLVQHKFWQDLEVGWRYAVPLFVESWQYNRDWQKQLLGIIEAFQVRFDGDSKKSLRIFSKDLGYSSFDTDSRKELLDELEKLGKRGWLDGDRRKERMVILSIQSGRLLYEMENYSDSLHIYLEVEKQLPETTLRLQKDVSQEFENIGDKLGWKEDGEIAFSEFQTAYDAYQLSVKLNPNNPSVWNRLGVILKQLEQYELAIEYFQKAIDIDPKYVTPYNNLGNIYDVLGQHELALKAFRKAIRLNPENATYHNNLGSVYAAQGQYELALQFFQKAIDIDPKYAIPYNNLGNIYDVLGETELSLKSYHKAIDLDPKYSNLLCIAVQNQKYYESQFLITLKPILKDLTVEISKQLSQALYKIRVGDLEQGINSLREILEIEKPPVSILLKVLKDAELIARFPPKLEGIDTRPLAEPKTC